MLKKVYGSWVPSGKYCAQMAHTFVASTTVLAADKHGFNIWIVLAGIFVFALVKEFLFDIYITEHDTAIGSACDADFYLLGSLLGLLATVTFWPVVFLTLVFVVPMTWIDVKYPG